MGKVSVAQVQQDAPGNASREVFQGLFKDLGKQAMAMEAILRAVCGRVDKMENWLTEVSFGMTELDLKLRNIAHNIDGTAAVDDEAQGPHRWAIPPPDDVKHLTPTVSKKIGADKKAIRVTGMAAAILDRLAATPASTPTAVEAENPGAKKKNKDKKHGTKKVKLSCLPEVPITSSLASVEAPPPVIQLPTPVAEAQHVPIPEEHPVIESTPVPVAIHEEPASASAPSEQVSALQPQKSETVKQQEEVVSATPQIDDEAPPEVQQTNTTIKEIPDAVEAPVEIKHDIIPVRSIAEPKADGIVKEHMATVSAPVPAITHSEESSSESSSAISPTKTDMLEQTPAALTSKVQNEGNEISQTGSEQNSSSTTNTTGLENEDTPASIESQPTAPVVTAESSAVNGNSSMNSSMTSAAKVATPVAKPVDKAPVPASSVSSLLPTVQIERSTEPFVLKGSAHTTTIVPSPVTAFPEPQPTAVADNVMVSDLGSGPLPAHHSSSSALECKRPVSSESTKVTTKAIKTTGVPIRSPVSSPPLSPHASETPVTAIDPLLPHRTAAHRRSSKMAPRPSLTKKLELSADSDPLRRLSGNKRGSGSKRTSITPAAQPTQQSSPQPSPNLQSIPQGSLAEKAAEIDEESGESESDSSSDGSGSSSEDDDAEAGAAVEEISKTMIALKKLKRAQMLSPEEEKELKERAHKKWFQLKGHIKEKQKKDVTNILLKRKKNVFTVSSRIELLEEKSREIFAALKQITNEMRDKNDRTTHETLRRRVADIEHSLQSVDSKIASLSAPAFEKVGDLEYEVNSLRSTVLLQLTTAQTEATARHSLLEEALATQRTLVESLALDFPAQLAAQAELFNEKLKQQPDHTGVLDNIRRSLKRKADLKLLKELESRLLGLDAENEDCLVRCLSCRKEVTNPHNERDTELDEQDIVSSGGGVSQLRKINPGPTSSRIYRSNVPFSAQPMVQDAILEESSDETFLPPQQALLQPLPQSISIQEPQLRQQLQSAGDSNASEKPPVVRVPSAKWSTPPETSLKREAKTPQPSPLSLMNIIATRAILSPDRPISAPVIPMKKKGIAAARSKSVLKSLSSPLDPPQKD
ncbi:hypothetical protein PF005_g583 [Phytophthora fragariae]|uniref:Uncharacterized protein n=1 Tax=Phytophthora fragariae TaxID=53985 RepID=A0A6A3FZK4_9STRA|nr:hypothetical protein PF009_g754 [Phytophthora fragariae]KAE9030848.1 hypothetical protein PF011_g404 [Phytophthora fragariae]KAE9139615.1 hypothetical protein PF010_g515 [Phytophthora fragariae]KAE9140554.1 hypothetical protein PF007_g609 [Phytophthora fragariae]KAE9155633.1 hypothetical protein PF006_g440 [Phytophthora fragariae]